MREMGWTWQQLQDTPLYVRRYCWDLLNTRAEAQAKAAKKQEKAHA